MSREKGFTLIEIVMVIILLGILAAVAIPRFIDMSGEAKKGATKGILGGVRGAIAIAFANKALRGGAKFPETAAALRGAMADGRIAANPYNNQTGVDVSSSALAGPSGAAIGWVYGANNAAVKGQFWSAVGGGVGANKF